ncbi:hypothetical protein J3R30DRAFT_3703693 [Lentinula aciculospora]|uniref:Uncharacterized protein n=1 Tax=Lentinula aciculospora TaxID=153920 RepID=A0A9W9DMK5_9AGAR|nr:hypothetical protein J3R30DRAFT_3703693 [Lentinula aciculospora]
MEQATNSPLWNTGALNDHILPATNSHFDSNSAPEAEVRTNPDRISETSSWSHQPLVAAAPCAKLERSPTTTIPSQNGPLNTSNAEETVDIDHYNSHNAWNGLEMPPTSSGCNGVERDFSDDKIRLASHPRNRNEGPALHPTRVRDVVLPLLLKNANLRDGDLSEDVFRVAQHVLTEEVCRSIEIQMEEAQRQLREACVTKVHPMREAPDENTGITLPLTMTSRPNGYGGLKSNGTTESESGDFHGSGWPPSKRRRIDTTPTSPMSSRQSSVQSITQSRSFRGQSAPNVINNHHQPQHPNFGTLHNHSPVLVEDSPSQIHQSNGLHGWSSHSHSSSTELKIPALTNSFQLPTVGTSLETFSPLPLSQNGILPLQPINRSPLLYAPHSACEVHLPDLSSRGQDRDMSSLSLNPSQTTDYVDDVSQHMLDELDVEMVPVTHKDEDAAASSLQVPGIWGIGMSLSNPGILEFGVDIDTETAQEWFRKSASGSDEHNKLVLHLTCLPLELVMSTLNNVFTEPGKGWMSLHTWPAQGSLVVDINHGEPQGQTWLPYYLGSENIPLDITNAIQQGHNKIRCIQLSSLQHIFAVHASIPLEPAPMQEPVDSNQLDVEIVIDYG